MKRITIIHQHFKVPAEGGAVRSYHLAEALQRRGYDVQVVCANASPHHTNAPFPIHALKVKYDSQFGFWRRIWSFIRFAKAAKTWCEQRDTGLLYLISTPLTVPWVGYAIGKPYILEIGDLWPDVPIQMGYLQNPLLKRWLFKWERKLYESALGIVALSPAIESAIRAKSISTPVATFTNLADILFYRTEKAGGDGYSSSGFDNQNPFILLYAGAMGVANGLDRMLKLATQVQHLPVKFVFMGKGPKKESLEQLAGTLELHNVQFLPHGNKEEVREQLQRANAVLVAYANYPLLSTGSPNKFFDGLAAGKPLFLTVEGWMKEIIQSHACGHSFVPEDTSSFVSALSNYLYSPEAYHTACHNASLLAENYAREKVLEDQISEMLKWVAFLKGA
jgi:glycosyltransferase involved in cell wall biosynthesis